MKSLFTRHILLGAVLICGCSQNPDRFNSKPTSGESQPVPSARYLVVNGTSGRLILLDPSHIPDPSRMQITLDIDCYLTALVRSGSQIYVCGMRSRGVLDSPGGVYEINIMDGSTRMVVDANLFGGGSDDIFVFSGTDGEDRIVICTADGVFVVSDAGEVTKIASAPTSATTRMPARWAMVGNDLLLFFSQSNGLYVMPLSQGAASEELKWSHVGSLSVDDMARSHLSDHVVFHARGAWRLYAHSESTMQFAESEVLWKRTAAARTVVVLEVDGEHVLAESTDYPSQTVWHSASWELKSRNWSTMDAVVVGSD
jgi:hypothetical protein